MKRLSGLVVLLAFWACDDSAKSCGSYDGSFRYLAKTGSKMMFAAGHKSNEGNHVYLYDGDEACAAGEVSGEVTGMVAEDFFVSAGDATYKAGSSLEKVSGITTATHAVSYRGYSFLGTAEGLARISGTDATLVDLGPLGYGDHAAEKLVVLNGDLYFLAVDENGQGGLIRYNNSSVIDLLATEDDIESVNPEILFVHDNKLIFLGYNDIGFGGFYYYDTIEGFREIGYFIGFYDVDAMAAAGDLVFFSRTGGFSGVGVFQIDDTDIDLISSSSGWTLLGEEAVAGSMLLYGNGFTRLSGGDILAVDGWSNQFEPGFYQPSAIGDVTIFDGCDNGSSDDDCYRETNAAGEEVATDGCRGDVDGLNCNLFKFDGADVTVAHKGHSDLQYVSRGGVTFNGRYYFEGMTAGGPIAFSVDTSGNVVVESFQ